MEGGGIIESRGSSSAAMAFTFCLCAAHTVKTMALVRDSGSTRQTLWAPIFSSCTEASLFAIRVYSVFAVASATSFRSFYHKFVDARKLFPSELLLLLLLLLCIIQFDNSTVCGTATYCTRAVSMPNEGNWKILPRWKMRSANVLLIASFQ